MVEVQKLLDAKKDKPRRGDQSQQVTLLLGLLRCGFCGCAYTASFVNKQRKNGSSRRYYYFKCTTKSRADAESCRGADLKSDMIDAAVVDYIREFSQNPKLLKAVIEASSEATRVGVKELERDRANLTKELSKLERDSMTLVDRLADPALRGITAINKRLTDLEYQQQRLKTKITDLTLQIRDRRDLDISTEEVEEAYKDFAGFWDELDFDERQYAIRLLIKEITLTFKKKEPEGKITIEAWGRSPKPLKISLGKRKSKKLRNQDVRHPGRGTNTCENIEGFERTPKSTPEYTPQTVVELLRHCLSEPQLHELVQHLNSLFETVSANPPTTICNCRKTKT